MTTGQPHTDGLGTDYGRIYLNYDYRDHTPQCANPATVRQCLERQIVHEFGHALGFFHEQNRSDFPGCASGTKPGHAGSHGDLLMGSADPESIMSPCFEGVFTGLLSGRDAYWVKRVYGGDPGITVVHGSRYALRSQNTRFIGAEPDLFEPNFWNVGSGGYKLWEVRRREGDGAVFYGDEIALRWDNRYVCPVQSIHDNGIALSLQRSACWWTVERTTPNGGARILDAVEPFRLRLESSEFGTVWFRTPVETHLRFLGPF